MKIKFRFFDLFKFAFSQINEFKSLGVALKNSLEILRTQGKYLKI